MRRRARTSAAAALPPGGPPDPSRSPRPDPTSDTKRCRGAAPAPAGLFGRRSSAKKAPPRDEDRLVLVDERQRPALLAAQKKKKQVRSVERRVAEQGCRSSSPRCGGRRRSGRRPSRRPSRENAIAGQDVLAVCRRSRPRGLRRLHLDSPGDDSLLEIDGHELVGAKGDRRCRRCDRS